MNLEIKGIIPAMVTPFTDNGEINKKSLRKLTGYLIDNGVHGLFPVGSTGEFYGMDIDKKREVLKTVLEEAGDRVPVYAGTGAITTKKTVELTTMAAELGVDAVSILTPMFIDPDQQELYEHYKTVAEQVDIPVLLYNNPGRTGVNLEAKLIEKLSKIDNIVGIKDSSGDMTLTGEYIRRTGEDFKVLAGRDTLILSTLTYGGKGSITATANIAPRLPVKIYEEYIKGNMEKALEAQYELAPLRLAFSFGTFPVVMKEGLNLIGIDTGPTLKPVGPLSEEKREKLKNILKDLDLI